MALKLSKYVVTTYEGDQAIVFSCRSGELIRMQRGSWDAIQYLNFSQVSPADLKFLRELTFLVPTDEDELKAVLEENESAAAISGTLGLLLVPTSICPLGCNQDIFGGYCGQIHGNAKMLPAVREDLIAWVDSVIQPWHHRLRISWFGGEPLAALDVMRELTVKIEDLCNKRSIEYVADITTGGTLLTEAVAIELHTQMAVSGASISIDGPKDIHDKRRCTKGGKPTFDTITGNINSIVNNDKLHSFVVSVRCNVDSRNVESVDRLIDYVIDKGWQANVDLYFVNVHPWGEKDNNAFAVPREQFAQSELIWYRRLLDAGFNPLLLPPRKKVVCRAVSNSQFVVGVDGAIHNCSETPLSGLKLGIPGPLHKSSSVKLPVLNQYHAFDLISNVHDVSANIGESSWKWNQDIREGKFPCTTCTYLPVCGGACPLSWHSGSDIPCPPFKDNFTERIQLFSRLNPTKQHTRTRVNKSEFAPFTLLGTLSLSAHEQEVVDEIENLLKSSISMARKGMLETAHRQLKAARSCHRTLPFNFLRTELLRASEMSVEGYIFYRTMNYDHATNIMINAFQRLDRAGRLSDIEVRPAQIQVLVNIAKIWLAERRQEAFRMTDEILTYLDSKQTLQIFDVNLACKSESDAHLNEAFDLLRDSVTLMLVECR